MRKTLNDPESHKEFQKYTDDNATPLIPEVLEKTIKELARDPDVVELFNKLAGADALPVRSISFSHPFIPTE